MGINETLYLYAGENKPRIKLTCTAEFSSIDLLSSFFGEMQDNYYVEFETCMTITDNLKISAKDYGGGAPFYVLEYNEVTQIMYLWRSEGVWDVNRAISSFYNNHLTKDVEGNVVKNNVGLVIEDGRFVQYLNKNPDMLEFLKSIDFKWVDGDTVDTFWGVFKILVEQESMNSTKKQKSGSDLKNDYFLRSLVVLSILKTKIQQNKLQLKNIFSEYFVKMAENKRTFKNCSTSTASSTSDSTPNSNSESSPVSSLSSFENTLDELPYTLQDPIGDVKKHSEPNYSYKSSSNLLQNFNSHFKYLIDDYETFHLKFHKINRRKYTKKSSANSKKVSKIIYSNNH